MTEQPIPQNIEAEYGVLGSLIIDPEAIALVADFLTPEDFYRDAHRTIYEVLLALYEKQQPADFITLCDELERRGTLHDIGGPGYVTALINQVPTSGNVEYYARIVTQKALYRRLIHIAGQIAASAYGEETDALEQAEQAIFALGQHGIASDFTPIGTVMTDCMTTLSTLYENRGSLIGVPTGFHTWMWRSQACNPPI